MFVPDIVAEIDAATRLPVAGGWKIPFCNLESSLVVPAIFCQMCVMPSVLGNVAARVSNVNPAWFSLYSILSVVFYVMLRVSMDSRSDDGAGFFALGFFATLFAFWLHIAVTRYRVRSALAIEGNEMSDCLYSCFCCFLGACTIIQMNDQFANTDRSASRPIGLMKSHYIKTQKAPDVAVAMVV